MNFIFRTTAIMLLLLSRTSAFAATPTSSGTEQTQLPEQQQNAVCSKRFKYCLSGLYGISSTEQASVIQPYTDFNTLYNQAPNAQKELEIICASAALLTGTDSIFAGTKSKQRALNKINYELGGKAERITDLARATIVANDVSSLVEAYEVLERETTVVKVKNRFKNPRKSGYRDLNLLVKLPKSGLIAEVQLHLKAIADVKSGPEHDLYEEIQLIERNALEQNRSLSELEIAKIANIRQVSKELYQNAWQPYITTHLQAA